MLHEVKVTQAYVGWLGFYLTLAGSVNIHGDRVGVRSAISKSLLVPK